MTQISLVQKIGYGPGKWYHSKGPYNESLRNYECVLFYVDGLYREKVTFEIEYEMYNAAFRYGDCSELYLSLYSGDTIKYLESYKAQILIPDKDMPQFGNYEVYTYGTNSNRFYFDESYTANLGYYTFSFDLDKSDLKFKNYNNYIEFSLISFGEDKHIFTENASRNLYYYDNVLDEINQNQKDYDDIYAKYSLIKLALFFVSLIFTYFIIRHIIKKYKKIKGNYSFYNSTVPEGYYRDIPSNLDPIFASALVFCKTKNKEEYSDGYSSIMLSLVRKGYLELAKINNLNDWVSYNVKIIIKYKPKNVLSEFSNDTLQEHNKLEPLTPTEEEYFNLINKYAQGNEIAMTLLNSKVSLDYQNTNTFVKKVQSSITSIGVNQGYFQKSDYEKPKKEIKSASTLYIFLSFWFIIICNFITSKTRLDFAYGSFFIIGFAFLISGFYIRKKAKNCILLTQFGEDEYTKWKGLYNFLNSETLMNERTVVELPIWEQYLVYATAFGISEKVIKALKIRCPNMEMSSMLSNPYYTSRNFVSTSNSFRTATRTAIHTANSGGYGYSSGSFRSGYRRRWPWWRRWSEADTKFSRNST